MLKPYSDCRILMFMIFILILHASVFYIYIVIMCWLLNSANINSSSRIWEHKTKKIHFKLIWFVVVMSDILLYIHLFILIRVEGAGANPSWPWPRGGYATDKSPAHHWKTNNHLHTYEWPINLHGLWEEAVVNSTQKDLNPEPWDHNANHKKYAI